MAALATCVVFEEQVEVPLALARWPTSAAWRSRTSFPRRAASTMSAAASRWTWPQRIFCHGTLKSEIVSVLQHYENRDAWDIFVDSTRVSSVVGDCSTEPDVVFICARLAAGRVRLVPKASNEPALRRGRGIGPISIVELVSHSSGHEDTRRLPPAYFAAGVCEFWLVDARGREPIFLIHHRGANGFQPVVPDADGFQASHVLGRRYRLNAARDADGNWEFDPRRSRLMPSPPQISPEEAVRRVAQVREALVGEVHKVIIGQDEMIEQMLVCVFARGHCLTIGVPGLAKTLAVSHAGPGAAAAVQRGSNSRPT